MSFLAHVDKNWKFKCCFEYFSATFSTSVEVIDIGTRQNFELGIKNIVKNTNPDACSKKPGGVESKSGLKRLGWQYT